MNFNKNYTVRRMPHTESLSKIYIDCEAKELLDLVTSWLSRSYKHMFIVHMAVNDKKLSILLVSSSMFADTIESFIIEWINILASSMEDALNTFESRMDKLVNEKVESLIDKLKSME